MITFYKMNGLGNKIIVADMRKQTCAFTAEAAKKLSQNKETAFDQIMAVYPPKKPNTDYHIDILNTDGSKAQACGNGTRCVVEWLYTERLGDQFVLDTAAGVICAQRLENGFVSVDMGPPYLHWSDIPTASSVEDTNHVQIELGPLKDACLVSMGNPHAIYFIENDIDEIALDNYGEKLENNVFFPERCNISIVQMLSSKDLKMRTWERGAGLTCACGTAACAAVVAANRRGLGSKKMRVQLPGGHLEIYWREDNHIIMTGATEFEFQGTLDPITGSTKKALS
ncbi:diaminopimelate epimerase [Bartonella tamiae]|uniref:Diaminopimelate epimerase n=1 Tax=Bartonella tamiae Th239 TaxID=1094558 RepID=J0R792_9HYPH|nr:diaminopimelate epimerase [Bartonella tamiae]EJF91604.1 diaminopimelate epimerase [Bartonella tamiae Th239]